MRLNIQLFASGTINGSSTASNSDCRIKWSSTANQDTNKSTVKATMQIYRSGSSSTTGTFSGNVTIDGTEYSVSKKFSPYNWGSWATVGTVSKTITHNTDGTKQITISGSLTQTGTSMAGTYTASGKITLDTIPRQSSISSITGLNIDETCTIGLKINKEGVYHKLFVSYDGTNYNEKTLSDPQSDIQTFTIDSSEIPNFQTQFDFDMYVKIQTFTDSAMTSQLGVDVISDKQNLSIPRYDSFFNGFQYSDRISEYNDYKLNTNDIIKNKSQVYLIVSCDKKYNNYIKTAFLNNFRGTIYLNKIYFEVEQSNTYNLQMIDSRDVMQTIVIDGSSYNSQIKTVQYTSPTIAYDVSRQSSTSQNIDIKITSNFYDGANLKSSALEIPEVSFKYSIDNGINWITYAIPSSDIITTSSQIIVDTTLESIDAFFYKKKFMYVITIKDKIGILENEENDLPPGQPALFSFNYNDEMYTNVYDHLLLDWKPVATEDMIPTALSELQNDAGFVVNSNSSPLFIIDSFDQYTGELASGNTKDMKYDISKTGYTPLAIAGVRSLGTRSSFINIYQWYVTDTEAHVTIRNIHASSALSKDDTLIRVLVLYAKK